MESKEKKMYWIIIDDTTRRLESGKLAVKCRCVCGLEKYVSVADMKRYKTRSCAKCSIKIRRESKIPLTKTLWTKIKYGATRRNLDFEISIEDAYNLYLDQGKKCKYTGLDINFPSSTVCNDRTASLDRIDSSKGYTIDNVQWIHKKVNTIKMDISEDEFLTICHLISKNCENPNVEIVNFLPSRKMKKNRDICECGGPKLATSKKCRKCFFNASSGKVIGD